MFTVEKININTYTNMYVQSGKDKCEKQGKELR